MGYIGNEIVQSRLYVDPNPPTPPSANYKYTFPITVFDAVRRSMDNSDSQTLTEVIEDIYKELKGKQPMIPARSPNYIVTYGGEAGAVGAIRITEKISWDPTKWSNEKIPTEKAVGDLLYQYGIIEKKDPTVPIPEEKRILWSDIIGRPSIYDDLGDDREGVINQEALTRIINDIKNNISSMNDDLILQLSDVNLKLKDHIEDKNNPHEVTIEQIGAAAKDIVDNHLNNFDNPHGVTKEQLGLGNVDNTSDIDKPISSATQEALDKIHEMINAINGDMGLMNFVTGIEYNQRTGRLDAIYIDGSRLGVTIVTDGLIDEIQFDEKKHELKVIELSGKTTKIPLDVLYNKYLGSDGSHIIVEIDKNNVINATIIPKSITSSEIADKAITTPLLADEAVTGDKIKECTITTIKYANHSITSEKIAKEGVEEINIKDRAVTEKKLFTSAQDNRVLAVRTGNTNPQWTQIVGDMISKEVIGTRHLIDQSITTDKIEDLAITEDKIAEDAIVTRKIKDSSVTTEKIADDSITTEKIKESINLRGIPTLENRPEFTANGNELIDAGWVREVLDKNAITDKNIGPRVITGKHLFSTPIKYQVLSVLESNGDPVWSRIKHEMLEDDSVRTVNIKDLAVTSDKLADNVILSRHLNVATVETVHIKDGNVTSEKIFPSEFANRVLAAVTENGYPLYTQIIEDMIANEAVTKDKIADQSVTTRKIAHEAPSNTVLVNSLEDHDPEWKKIGTDLIEDQAITGRKIFPSKDPNKVLAVRDAGTSPYYMKVNGEMLEDECIENRHLTDNAVEGDNIADKSIESRHMTDGAVENNAIATGAIDGRTMFKPHHGFQVLAVNGDPHADAEWSKVTSEMIERLAVTPDKIFSSNYSRRVLAVKNAGDEPEYILITGDYIEDNTIPSSKLKENLILYGNPTISEHPRDDSNDYTIPDTNWVNKAIAKELENYAPKDIVTEITPENMFTTDEAPRVLGVDTPNGVPKYLQIVTDMIRNAAVTGTKIERDVKLLGSPSIEIRPDATASDKTNKGNLLPDCQWVLDRIQEERKDFYEELKEKICCLQDIDPMKVKTDRIIVSPIEDMNIESMGDAVLEGNRVPVAYTESIDYDGETFAPIPYHRIRDIILRAAEPHESTIINLGDTDVEPVPYYRIKGLVDGTVTPNVSGTGFEIDVDVLNSQLGCCGCQNDGDDRSYMTPISDLTIKQLILGTAIGVPNEPISVYGKKIEPIPDSTIEDISTGRIVLTKGSDPVEINGELLEPIPVDRIRGLITGELTPRDSIPLDITEYDEELESDKELTIGSVITDYLKDRCVTGQKMFTTAEDNSILAVLEGNSDPVWTKVDTEMIKDRAINGKKIFSSDVGNRVLGVVNPGDDPVWMRINDGMFDDNCIDTRHLRDNAVTSVKILDYAITATKLAKEKMIETFHLFDQAVTNRKLADKAVTNTKIADHTIEGIKIARRTEIPAYTCVEEHRDYSTRALRNTILSPKTPYGEGKNGDIWMQFA